MCSGIPQAQADWHDSTTRPAPGGRAATPRHGATGFPRTVVILAAGLGSRLSPATKRPKPLVEVLGLSLAERVLCAFVEDLGVRRIVVVLGHQAEIVEAHFAEIARRRGAAIEFVLAPNWQMGNGASARSVEGRVSTPFFLAMTDHLFEPDMVRALAAQPPGEGQVCLAIDSATEDILDPEDVTRVRQTNGLIEEIGKGLEAWNAADTGLFLCTESLFEGLERSAAAGRHGLSDGIQELAAEGRVRAMDVTGQRWLDIDTPADLRHAENWLSRAETGKASDGPVSRYLNRPISRRLTRYLVRTPLAPNQISLLSWGLCVSAAALFILGGYWFLALGGLIAQIASIVDGCDGEVARLKRLQSDFGAWLDAVLDRYADGFLLFGLLWHGYAAGGDPVILFVGFAAITGSFMSSYTADKYDGLMAKRMADRRPLRLGRDLRVFMIFLGAVLNLATTALLVIAVVMNLDVLRRILVCRKADPT
jgi:CDP-L-myo-inositol myo-inositolphosphotransferase